VQATVRDFSPETRAGSVLLDDGTVLPFDAPAFDTSGLRTLRFGQRVRVHVAGEGPERHVTRLTLVTFAEPGP
jgi:2-phospho-L-lactate/phosphoenolpyruvate guanylyltransferase